MFFKKMNLFINFRYKIYRYHHWRFCSKVFKGDQLPHQRACIARVKDFRIHHHLV